MLQKQEKQATLPGVFSTLAAGFEMTTRYLWLMIIPALLDLFLWIGPRLSFRPLIESLATQMPVQGMPVDMGALLDLYATRLNHFTYLSVSLVGVPTLMNGLTPEKVPVQPLVIERAGYGEWFGYLLLFTVGGLLLAAVYYSLIAYTMRRVGASAAGTPMPPLRLLRRTTRTWSRLLGLTALFLAFVLVITVPVALLAGFVSLLSQTLATLVLMGALVLIIWLVMFFSYTPQGMTLNPSGFMTAMAESVRLFRANLPASLGLLFIVTLIRRLLELVLLTADSGTWVTGINLLAHAYICTALIMALFIFYRDRYTAFLQEAQTQTGVDQVKQ
jgi:hypothetical protein